MFNSNNEKLRETKYFYHADHLGSTSLITDQNGDVVEESLYSPFGEPIQGGETTRFDYTGKEYDKTTKLHDFKARQYKSEWYSLIRFEAAKHILRILYYLIYHLSIFCIKCFQ